MSYRVINKGNFSEPRIENFVSLSRYLFIEEDGQKFLLLNFCNGRDEAVTGVRLAVSQKDALGKTLAVRTADYLVNDAKPSSPFVLTDKIPLDNKCFDFSVKIISADFGNYTYSAEGNSLSLSYQKERTIHTPVRPDSTQAIKRSVTARKFKIPVIVCSVSLLVLALSTFFTYYHLQNTIKNSDTFFHAGVEYVFEGNDKSENSNIYVVGSTSSAKDILIPEKVKGHAVTRLNTNAFAGNNTIRTLTVKAPIEIPADAFNSCENLSIVNLENVTRIGNNAFAGNIRLSALNASNLKEIAAAAFLRCTNLSTVKISDSETVLKIKPRAFERCVNLKTVEIGQFIDFSEHTAIFDGNYYVESLNLKNYNYPFEADDVFYDDTTDKTLSELFGAKFNMFGFSNRLREVTIDYTTKIPDNFCYLLPLTTLTINNLELSEVGDSAFNSCNALKTLNVPLAFESVGDYAFFNTAIESFDASSLRHIGDYAFSKCYALTAFDLKHNTQLEYLGVSAFRGSNALKSFYLPSTLTQISDYSFADCSGLTEFTAPGALDLIGDSAFENCYALKAAPIETAEFIGANAFRNCFALTSLNFSQSLAIVGNGAFMGCNRLTRVLMPASVTQIGYGAFKDCSSLIEMHLPFIGVNPGSGRFAYIFDASGTAFSVPKSLETVTVNSVSSIASYAFIDCENIKEIIISGDYNSIGAYAFYGCKSLPRFVIPASVTQIGENAFEGCYKLHEIYNLSLLNIGSFSSAYGKAGNCAINVYKALNQGPMPRLGFSDFEFGQRIIDGKWFLINYTGAKTALELPEAEQIQGDGITSYEVIKYLMIGNDKIKTLSVPQSVTAIGEYAFANCTALTSAVVGGSVGVIGASAFKGCNSLKDITLPFVGGSAGSNQFFSYIFGSLSSSNSSTVPAALKTVTLTNMLYLTDYAFANCDGLTGINLPENLLGVGSYAFSGCDSLESVTVPSGVSAIGFAAFVGCTSLKEITLPFVGDSKVSNRSFSFIFGETKTGYSSLIPDSLQTVTITNATVIPDYAFAACSYISTVNLPSMLEKIGVEAFYNCNNIKNINLPDNLKLIDNRAFIYCNSLEEIVLPSSVQIGVEAFFNCSSLKKVTLSGEALIGQEAFYRCHALREVYNLSEMNISAGSTDNGWIAYNAIAVYESLTDAPMEEVILSDVVFMYYKNTWTIVDYIGGAENLVLSEFEYNGARITSYRIVSGAFAYKSMLTLTIGSEVSYIGENAFENCYNLKTIRFVDSVITELADYVFNGCTSLTSIELPQSLTTIGAGAFMYCNRLYTITIPKNVTEIKGSAFYSCFALVDIYNLSDSLTFEKGSYDNGYIARYAFRINTSADTKPLDTVIFEKARFILYGGEWYLVCVESNSQSVSLPKAFVFGEEKISSYILKESAFSYLHFSAIFIPGSVSQIIQEVDVSVYFTVDSIYYGGSSAEWSALVSGLVDSLLKKFSGVKYNSNGF